MFCFDLLYAIIFLDLICGLLSSAVCDHSVMLHSVIFILSVFCWLVLSSIPNDATCVCIAIEPMIGKSLFKTKDSEDSTLCNNDCTRLEGISKVQVVYTCFYQSLFSHHVLRAFHSAIVAWRSWALFGVLSKYT